MKSVHTFRTGRHKGQADIFLLFQYIFDFNKLVTERVIEATDPKF